MGPRLSKPYRHSITRAFQSMRIAPPEKLRIPALKSGGAKTDFEMVNMFGDRVDDAYELHTRLARDLGGPLSGGRRSTPPTYKTRLAGELMSYGFEEPDMSIKGGLWASTTSKEGLEHTIEVRSTKNQSNVASALIITHALESVFFQSAEVLLRWNGDSVFAQPETARIGFKVLAEAKLFTTAASLRQARSEWGPIIQSLVSDADSSDTTAITAMRVALELSRQRREPCVANYEGQQLPVEPLIHTIQQKMVRTTEAQKAWRAGETNVKFEDAIAVNRAAKGLYSIDSTVALKRAYQHDETFHNGPAFSVEYDAHEGVVWITETILPHSGQTISPLMLDLLNAAIKLWPASAVAVDPAIGLYD